MLIATVDCGEWGGGGGSFGSASRSDVVEALLSFASRIALAGMVQRLGARRMSAGFTVCVAIAIPFAEISYVASLVSSPLAWRYSSRARMVMAVSRVLF